MGLFDVNEDVVQMTYEDAVQKAGGDVWKAEESPDVQQAVSMFAEKNGCSYDDAWNIAANPGKKLSNSGGDTGQNSNHYYYNGGNREDNRFGYEKRAAVWKAIIGTLIFLATVFFIPVLIYGDWYSASAFYIGYFAFMIVMIAAIVVLKIRYDAEENKVVKKIWELMETGKFDDILADKRYTSSCKTEKICKTYEVVKTNEKLIVARLGGREYFVRLYPDFAPRLVKETAESRDRADGKGVDISRFNSILARLYDPENELGTTENYDICFQTAQQAYDRLNV